MPALHKRASTLLLQREQGDKSFDCIRVKKKSVKYIRSRSSFTKNRIGGKCYQVRVVGLKRGCFLLLKIRCRTNFRPSGPDLFLSNMNALATYRQHGAERKAPKWLLSKLASQRQPLFRISHVRSTKAMAWPTRTPSTVWTCVANLSHRRALWGHQSNAVFSGPFNCRYTIKEQIDPEGQPKMNV